MYHSQNREAEIIIKYFNGNIGCLLDLGCNDGKTFSNSYDLIELGWLAVLVDASPIAYAKAKELHEDNSSVVVYNYAIADEDRQGILMQSGSHVPHGTDVALVSTIDKWEMQRWPNVKFEEVDCEWVTFKTFHKKTNGLKFPFISIDIEGCDEIVLKQINLSEVGCKCLCIEWNSIPSLAKQYTDYCAQFGLKEIHRNGENIIFAL